jgi:hypothetical protein
VLDREPSNPDLVVDALVGYGLSGPLWGRMADFVGNIDDERPESTISLGTTVPSRCRRSACTGLARSSPRTSASRNPFTNTPAS